MRSGRKQFWTAALGASSGPVNYAVLQAITLAVITNRGDVPDAANFFLAQAVATPLAQFSALRLKEQLAVEAVTTAFAARLRRLAAVSMVVFALVSVGWFTLAEGERAVVGVAVLFANLAQGVVFAYQGRRARVGDFFRPSQVDTGLGLLTLLSITAGYLIFGRLSVGAALMAVTWSAVALALVLAETRRQTVDESNAAAPSFGSDLVNGASAMAQVGQISVARIGTELLVGAAALAAIGTASFLLRTGSIVVIGGRAAMAPAISKANAAGRIESFSRRTSARINSLVLAASAGGVLVGFYVARPAIALIFGSNVAPSNVTGALIVGSGALLYGSMLLSQLAIALGSGTGLLRANVYSVVVTLIVVLAAAPTYGEEGGALALAAGFATKYVLVAWINRGHRGAWSRLDLPVAVGAAAAIVFLVFVGQSIVFDHERLPDNGVDGIVVLSGGRGERLDRGLELVDEYQPQYLILMIPDDWRNSASESVREVCRSGLVGDVEVVCLPPKPDSTAGEAITTVNFATENGIEQLLMVSSDFHVARGERWFRRCGLDVFTAAAPTERELDRMKREWMATVDSLLFQRSCPRQS